MGQVTSNLLGPPLAAVLLAGCGDGDATVRPTTVLRVVDPYDCGHIEATTDVEPVCGQYWELQVGLT